VRKVKIAKLFLVLGVVLALGLMVGPAFAYDVEAVPVDPLGDGIEEIEDDGTLVATIYYTSDFEVLGYIMENVIRINVNIPTVVEEDGYTVNDISYVNAYLRVKGNNFTPKNKVTGVFVNKGDSWIEFYFDDLKEMKSGGGDIGNAHFHMEFDVTWTPDGGDPVTETVKFGINCHAVELVE